MSFGFLTSGVFSTGKIVSFRLLFKTIYFPSAAKSWQKPKTGFPSRPVLSAGTLRLTSDFKGRLARFRQIDSTRTQVFILLFIDFTELFQLGFKMVVVRASSLKASWGDTSITQIIQTILLDGR